MTSRADMLMEIEHWRSWHGKLVIQLVAAGQKSFGRVDEAVGTIIAERDQLRADAERYRWLLDQHERINPSEASIWERMMMCNSTGWTLDEFIDAERGK